MSAQEHNAHIDHSHPYDEEDRSAQHSSPLRASRRHIHPAAQER